MSGKDDDVRTITDGRDRQDATRRLVPETVSWSRRMLDRARDAAGGMTAPIWLWPCTFVGAGVRTLGKPRVRNRGLIEIRDDVIIDSRFSPSELVTSRNGRIVIGSRVVIGRGVMLFASRLVEIGDRATLGPYCVVSDVDCVDAPEQEHGDSMPIWIGDEVVIGARVTVLPGATVGARSWILPGSIVAGEIPPGVVAGGNPARLVRKLHVPAVTPVAPSPAALGLAPDASAGLPR